MLKAMIYFSRRTMMALEAGISLERVMDLAVGDDLSRLKELAADQIEERSKKIMDEIRFSFAEMGVE
jgi:type II secretory pathway component PulF